METLNTWWDGLNFVLKIFYTIGMFSTAIIGVQTLLSMIGIGGDHDVDFAGDVDVDVDVVDHSGELPSDADDGVGFLSVRTIVGFLAGFGWAGAAAITLGSNLFVGLIIAVITGIAMMFALYGLMKLFWSMREDGTLDYANAIGEVGSVYLPIPGNGEKPGQIEVMVQGRLQVIPAFTSKPDRIGNREKVLVIGLNEDNSLQVIPHEPA